MNTNEKLEVFRKLNGLGITQIEKAFESQDDDLRKHLIRKFETLREDHGQYGNFKFLFQLDLENAKLLLNSIGM